jgi:hypothetical protein
MRAQGKRPSGLAEGVREANERIALQAERQKVWFGIPMLCECGDPGCSELFLVSLDGYRQARGETPFLIAPSHLK